MNGCANKLNQISDHELDVIMEQVDSRIKERMEAYQKQETDYVEAKILAALEKYFSSTETRKLPL